MAKIALTIAGSDSGGGAGIQADIKTMSALGVYAASVVTAVTAQNTCAVTNVHLVPVNSITDQIAAVLSDLPPDAVKIGMLARADIINATVEALASCRAPIVLDPVMVAKSGDKLLEDDAVGALRRHLIPRAAVLTPNIPEAAALLQTGAAQTPEDVTAQGRALLDLGAEAVLMKGGHSRGEVCHDFLITPHEVMRLSAPRQATQNTHGTGCTLSSAIAAYLARGVELPEATRRAHAYLQAAIIAADGLGIGAGHGPVHHFHAMWPDD